MLDNLMLWLGLIAVVLFVIVPGLMFWHSRHEHTDYVSGSFLPHSDCDELFGCSEEMRMFRKIL